MTGKMPLAAAGTALLMTIRAGNPRQRLGNQARRIVATLSRQFERGPSSLEARLSLDNLAHHPHTGDS
ncbi:hypothetical protein SDC9_159416 [bioreactor metagenome]|uniref:Uncharacterized protein n=1 Tax=bioreactor metagenome TaxID=1076179 RepID=A0A645FI17_9ZZZZ